MSKFANRADKEENRTKGVLLRCIPVEIGGLPCFQVESDDRNFCLPLDLVMQHFIAPYEALEGCVIRAMFDESDRVIEGGAGIGMSTLNLLKCGSFVVAYEPLSDYAEVARYNVRWNGLSAEIKTVALALANGKLHFSRRTIPSASSALPDELYPEKTREAIEVECVNINEEVERYSINGLHFDMEGTEYELLMSMDLSPINKISMEVHPTVLGVDKVEEMFQHLERSGFESAMMAGKIFYPKSNYAIAFARPEFLPEVRADV